MPVCIYWFIAVILSNTRGKPNEQISFREVALSSNINAVKRIKTKKGLQRDSEEICYK